MGFGYNLGHMVAALHDKHYDISMAKCNKRQDTIEGHQNNLEVMQRLLSAIAAERQKDKKRVDLSDQTELVDEARTVCPELLPNGVYEWKTEDQITILVEALNAVCSHITRKVSPEMMYLTEELQRLPEIARIGSHSLKTLGDEVSQSVRNQTK
jgi:hypothetical protein